MNLKYVLGSYIQQTDRRIEEWEESKQAQVDLRDSNVPTITELNAQMARVMASVRNFRIRAGDQLEEPPDSPPCDESVIDDGGPLKVEIDPDP